MLPSFALTDATAARVADICGRLDMTPLAIGLAAALVAFLGIDGIAARLDDRFQLLPGNRSAPARQQRLQAAVE